MHVLERGNFDKLVQEHDAVLVKFFSPDCEHCRDMADDFRQAATQLKAQGSPARLAEVDCAAAGMEMLLTTYRYAGVCPLLVIIWYTCLGLAWRHCSQAL